MRIIQTEYSFKKVFYHLEQAVDDAIGDNHDSICIMDDTTFGFVKFNALCLEKNVKPIFGLRLMLTDKKVKSRSKYDSFETCKAVYLVAKSTQGVRDLYKLYTKSTEQKYYFNRIYNEDLEGIDCLEIDPKYIPNVKYSKEEDINTYQCISGSRGIPANPEHQIEDKYPCIMEELAKGLNAALPKAKMIKYNGIKSFELECWKGLDHLKLSGNKEYEDRLEYEIDMIKSKDFQDYFMIVSEMIMDARKTMITGPGRGSSGGSLVCYCLGITNIDPIRFGLIFERFIDTNRFDLPDIDSDYPDSQRQKVIGNIAKRYTSAYQLGIVSRYKPKSVINDFAKEYLIEPFELEDLKNSIVERSSGDARAQACLEDTYIGTDPGMEFIRKFPAMRSTIPAENHARHFGKHAAGIIVVDEDISNYAALDTITGNLCMEGNDAESIGLLKIDCLGLRTLSVIENCLRLSGVPIDDIYSIDLEDREVLDIFKTDDLADIFQFDGETVNRINKQIEVNCFSDLAAITSLGRPGALNSGGTNDYIKVGRGKAEPIYYGEIYKRVTESTYGIVVFQEQTMVLLREYGKLSWGDVNIMRKIISKSRGDEFFSTYRDKFIQGAIDSGENEDEAIIVWDAIKAMGCLSGDTEILNPFPNQNQPQKYILLKDLYKSGGYSSIERGFYCEVTRADNKDKQCVKQSIYMVEKDGYIRPNRLIDIYKSGIKETFQVIVKKLDGELAGIRATKDHKFMIPGELFKKLKDLKVGDVICMMGGKRKPLKFKGTGSGGHNKTNGNDIESWIKISKRLLSMADLCVICNKEKAIEIHHINGDHYDNTPGNHSAVCRKCHKKEHVKLDGVVCVPHKRGKLQEYATIISIAEPKFEMTYDISMPKPYNFIANEFVVHNSYAFNKSHAVAYAMISYWCAYCKVKYPLNFLAANLNNAKDEKHGLKMLRQYVKINKIEYVPVDPFISDVGWTIQDGKLIGGLTNIAGIGEKTAQGIIDKRENGAPLTKALFEKMMNPITAYDELYPLSEKYKDLYRDNDITKIEDLETGVSATTIGKILIKDLRDRNDIQFIIRRGGTKVTSDRYFLSVIIEDDTGTVKCTIAPFDMDRLEGMQLSKDLIIGDVVAVKGTIRDGWQSISVSEITKV